MGPIRVGRPSATKLALFHLLVAVQSVLALLPVTFDGGVVKAYAAGREHFERSV